MLEKNLIFLYAAQFRRKEKSPASPKEIQLNDQQYQQFIQFVESKNIDFKTETEKKLNALIASAKDDDYYERISTSIEELKKTISNEKKRDLIHFKKEIKDLLESEIAFHYFYQRGRVEQSWSNDVVLQKGLNTLSQLEEYQKIIRP